jgi:hypothetical protein
VALTGPESTGVEAVMPQPLLRGLAACSLLPLCAAALAAPPAPAAPCESRNLGFDVAEAGWKHLPMSRKKAHTAYAVEREGSRSVLVARAEASASLYVAPLPKPMQVPATLRWSWKTDAAVPGADNREKRFEDAPLRVIVAFDGDADTLPAGERTQRKLAESLSGRAPPYASLMYIWTDKVAAETLIPSAHTSQLKMLAVGPGPGGGGLGDWQNFERNLAADFKRAYGAAPGPLLGVAVLTDTDNTGAKASGRYADLRLQCAGP